ncbi:MAG TPA: hypothetical protein ENN68_07195 [Methanomicrobia archaeon]|nr:hypothetical protein [Methanomicrobia archaeon]
MGRIEQPPSWILKYKEQIEAGTITVEQILAEENRLRETPIKISSVTRAINAMGLPISGLRGRTKGPAQSTALIEGGERDDDPNVMETAPAWVQQYRDRIEQGTITAEQILEAENERRDVPIKITTVKRVVKAMVHSGDVMPNDENDELAAARENSGGEDSSTAALKGPGWLQKYHDRIVAGTITVDEILAEENKSRESPIKRSSVTRAINALGYPTSQLQRKATKEAEMSENDHSEEQDTKATSEEKGPGWLQKYRDRIVVGTITVDEILAEENKSRESPIKRSSVTRAINAMGFTIAGMRREKRGVPKVEEAPMKKAVKAEAFVYGSSLGKLSETTLKRFNELKKSWEEELGKPLQNDYFLNVLIALAKLAECGKTLTSIPS